MRELPRTTQLLEQGIDAGLHVGAQLSVSLRGERIIDYAVGIASPEHDMTADSMMTWMSSSKPVTAIAIAMLWEQDKLGLDDRVSRYVEGFDAGNKGAITIRHLLTHTAGLADIKIGWPHDAYDDIVATIAAAEMPDDFLPGRDAKYHPSTSWFLLGHIVHRLTGERIDAFARQHIFDALAMHDSYLAMPRATAERYADRLGRMHLTRRGMSEPAPESMPYLDRSDRCAPGATGRGPMRDLCSLYDMLVAGGERGGQRVLQPQTVEAFTARHRVGLFDHGFKRVMDWGLGFVVDASKYHEDKPQPYGFGAHASPRAFGHGGHQSSNAFADPEHGLAVAWVCNGMPGPAKHDQRNHAINTAIYEDLGLT